METYKKSSTVSIDELLKQLDETPEIDLDPNVNQAEDVYRFIITNNINPGPYLIRVDTLHKYYSLQNYENLTLNRFKTRLSRYFEFIIRNKIQYVQLDDSKLNLFKKLNKIKKNQSLIKTKSVKYQTHFEHYLNRYQIKNGNCWAELRQLFNLYDKWTYEFKTKTILNKAAFKEFLNVYFDKRTDKKGQSYYGVNEEFFKTLKQSTYKQNYDITEKEDKEKSTEVSSVKPKV